MARKQFTKRSDNAGALGMKVVRNGVTEEIKPSQEPINKIIERAHENAVQREKTNTMLGLIVVIMAFAFGFVSAFAVMYFLQ